jgi:formylglycine-generating enzyme required for sulfatase activity/CRP-like cAMP-binding protein
MGAVKKLIDKKVLRTLVPINALSAIHIEEISKKAIIEDVRSGTYVFKRGDRDNQTVFVLEGKVELVDDKREVVATVMAGSENARHPLAHKQPRQQSARAAGKVTVARIDSSLLDVLLTWDESSGYDVKEIDAQEDDDWMTRMLQSQAFLQLPPSNIHQLLMRLEAVSFSAGDVVVSQGEDGDYFYIVKSGRLAVTRKASVRSKEVLLAELGEGACFGEEALVSGTKRNASVMMTTDGALMRLSKTDFNELLCASLVHEEDYEGAQKLVAKGAQWLDVRLPGEFENQAIKDSINVPLSALREQCQELDADTDYIICCDTGRRSAAGAFVLSQCGLNVYTLKNGLMDVPDDALTVQSPPKEPEPAKEADIIPFASEARAGNEAGPREASASNDGEQVDALLIDKLAASEVDKLALEKKLEEVAAERDVAHQELTKLGSEQQAHKADLEKIQVDVGSLQKQLAEAEQQSAASSKEMQALQDKLGQREAKIEAGKQKLTSVETEKQCLQDELAGLQQTLTHIQSSSEGRDDALRNELEKMSARLAEERQMHSRQSGELQDELAKIREDYTQLGQRTSQVAGERDAAVGSLDDIHSELSEARKQLEGAGEERQLLEQRLADADEQVNSGQSNAGELQEQLQQAKQIADEQLENVRAELGTETDNLKQQIGILEERLEDTHRTAGSDQEALSKQLELVQQELKVEKSGHRDQAEQREQLEQQLSELRQQLDVAVQEARQQLDQIHSDAVAEKAGLGKHLESLQQEVDSKQKQVEEFEESRRLFEEKLAELQQQVQEKDEQLQQREKDESDNDLLRNRFDESEVQIQTLNSELDGERARYAGAEKRIAELDEQLARKDKDHEADIASTREAMSRVQNETDNIKREQTRVMEANRKLERDLDRERHDHESEVHRLHKELKSVAGETGAGLEAELDALQEKIKQDARVRDDLEIKLGERSAQVEDSRADIEKLSLQFTQAQESARQAEQQLLETTQLANEEMAVRIEVEEKAQAALRDELAAVIGERNQSQERLTVQQQELEELSTGLDSARQALAESDIALEAQVSKLSAERDIALEKQELVQQELDQLRAEAEVTRGLVDMQLPAGEVDAVLREELEQAKKNVDVAVRLRGQTEDRVGELESELEEMRSRLSEIKKEPAESLPEGHIPSLDDSDPYAAALLTPEYPDDVDSDATVATVLLEDGQNVAEMAVGSVPASSQAGGRKGLIVSLLIVVMMVAGAGIWWFSNQPSKSTGAMAPDLPVAGASVPAGLEEVADKGTADQQTESDTEAQTSALREEDSRSSVASSPAPVPESRQDTVTQSPPPDKLAVAEIQPPKQRIIPNFAKGGSDRILDDMSIGAKEGSGASEVSEVPGKVAVVTESEDIEPAPAPAKPQPVRTYSQPLSTGGRGPTLVELQADSFLMGSSSTSANFDERPQHTVELRLFAISKREVTFDEYSKFVNDTRRRRPADEGWGRGQRPVINVSWQDAVAYTEWLSEQTGSHYRLPTEAEWEFAASSGNEARFWWGNDVGSQYANCFDCGSEWSGVKTAPVGSFSASTYAVQDMLGNVMEWVQDCYQKSYSSAPADGSAVITAGDCEQRVVRGGGFDSPADSARSASRNSRIETSRLNNLGFRVVKAAH